MVAPAPEVVLLRSKVHRSISSEVKACGEKLMPDFPSRNEQSRNHTCPA
jgi:hypothetical protein